MNRVAIAALSVLCLAATPALSAEKNQALKRFELRVINVSDGYISALHARNLTTNKLLSDRLDGEDPIGPGKTRVVVIEDGTGECFWRIQAVLTDRRTAKRAVNVCELASWTIRNNGELND